MGRRTPTRAFLYGLGFRLGELSLRAALRVLPRVPERWLEAIWEAVWRLTFLLQRRRARRMEANLALVMPERFETRAERRTVVRTACRHLYRSVLDATLAVTHEAARARRKAIPIEGAERLEAALARGRGVVAVTAHLGGFTMVPIRLAVDHPVSLVANRPDDARVAGLLDRCREVVGVATVPVRPAREAARGALVALREGRVLVLLADEFKTGGVEVEFLGHPASAPRGPVTLAMRTGAALLPVFALRGPDDRLRLEVGAEIELERGGDPVVDVSTNAARVCAEIEETIRRHPEQWNWANFRARARTPARKFSLRPRAPEATPPA
jgi:KDO2-lipid IV(A) lauroyltransferase